ncbi:DUF2244 domain-containing protein [Falsiroseomonas sp. CW058]|uniref:DUF2244 domain-containing protein n=1 Tax=Falsiroseomonas sp. CW058 TaxID=3388664 RepID=UPI003D31C7A3
MPSSPSPAGPILFEAVSTPPRSLSATGMRWLCGLAIPAACVPALLFTLLGAWPVLPILGAELALVLGLVALHRRWTAAQVEVVVLTPDRLRVLAADGRGGRQEVALDPYWARLELRERPGAVPALRLAARGRSVEVGRFLSEAEKRDLAAALEEALRRYRSPVFDNPQLRDG